MAGVKGCWLCGGRLAPGCVQRHCWCWLGCAVLLVLFLDFLWSVQISWKMGFLEEYDGGVVGVSWPLPSSLHTSGSSCHTPAADVLEWEWLVIFYLMDVFYKVICAPPLISLVLPLKKQDGAVMWPLPSGPFTSGSSFHIPAVDVIESGSFKVYIIICAISLVLHLNVVCRTKVKSFISAWFHDFDYNACNFNCVLLMTCKIFATLSLMSTVQYCTGINGRYWVRVYFY